MAALPPTLRSRLGRIMSTLAEVVEERNEAERKLNETRLTISELKRGEGKAQIDTGMQTPPSPPILRQL